MSLKMPKTKTTGESICVISRNCRNRRFPLKRVHAVAYAAGIAISKQSIVAAPLTKALFTKACPNPTACHMSTKFCNRIFFGNQTGGKVRISARGFMAVEIMTANGNRITMTKGDKHIHETMVFFV